MIYADVAELADALDLGSSVARRECSSHFIRTTKNQLERVGFFIVRPISHRLWLGFSEVTLDL